MPVRVFFYVQHLLGIGHLVRASLIADALKASGADVTMVIGGQPIPGYPHKSITTVKLPSLAAGPGGFSELVDQDGNVATDDYRDKRSNALLTAFRDCKPDVVLVEAFPFGRRQLSFELIPLLQSAREMQRPPFIACSVRDILQQRSLKRNKETADIANRYFDYILVHGDPTFVRLEETFPLTSKLTAAIEYTGIVSAAPGQLEGVAYDVIVSAGGGVAGAAIMRCALEARALTTLSNASWCFLTGPNLDGSVHKWLKSNAGDGVTVEPNRSDFRALLQNSKLSISQAGYNTVADIMRAQCRSVLVPFAQGSESEQSLRAEILHAKGFSYIVSETALSQTKLAAVIDRATQSEMPDFDQLPDTRGAETTAAFLINKAENRPGSV